MNKQKIIAISSLSLAFLVMAGTAIAAMTLNTNTITSDGALNITPTGQPVTVNGDLTITGSCTGCGGVGSTSDTQILFNNGGSVGGSADLTWDPTQYTINVTDSGSTGDNFIQVFEPTLNNNSPLGVPSTVAGGISAFDPNHGGLSFTGFTDTTAQALNFTAFSKGSFTPSDNSALIQLNTYDDSNSPFDQKTIFGISNDVTNNSPGLHKWMVQLVEGNGVNAGGFPDSVPLFGLGTDSQTVPGAILDVRNPITLTNFAANKARVVGLFEGRQDGQTGDLIQAKLIGGSPIFRVDTNGSVTATDFATSGLGSHLKTSGANNDLDGTIAISSATSAAHTFAAAFTSAPICSLTPTTNPGATTYWVTASTSAVTANISTSGTITFNYHCIGNPN